MGSIIPPSFAHFGGPFELGAAFRASEPGDFAADFQVHVVVGRPGEEGTEVERLAQPTIEDDEDAALPCTSTSRLSPYLKRRKRHAGRFRRDADHPTGRRSCRARELPFQPDLPRGVCPTDLQWSGAEHLEISTFFSAEANGIAGGSQENLISI